MASIPAVRALIASGKVKPPPDVTISEDALYPETDGMPVGEPEWHIVALMYLLEVLRLHFAQVPEVYVAGDMFLYYEQGNPQAAVAPDVMVIRGVDKSPRAFYKVWQEKQVPCCIVEITSQSSRLDDLGTKRALYALLGVPEYFVFDPCGDVLDPPLVRFRLSERGEYEREDGQTLDSAALGLRFSVEEGRIRAYDLATGERLRDLEEERMAREAAEAEVRRLRGELERLRRQS